VSHLLRSHLDWDRADPDATGEAAPASTPGAGRDEGDTMRKACFNLYLSWLLVFGGSAPLLRRA
jgi:hypothetical protein